MDRDKAGGLDRRDVQAWIIARTRKRTRTFKIFQQKNSVFSAPVNCSRRVPIILQYGIAATTKFQREPSL